MRLGPRARYPPWAFLRPVPEFLSTMSKRGPKEKTKSHRASFTERSLWFLFWCMVIVATGTAGAMVGGFLGFLSQQPPIERLEHYAPPQVTRVFDRTGVNVVANFYEENRELLPLSKMPKHLLDAFIAVEDERFYTHFGVDPQGILRALVVNLRTHSRRQGGSTITQQMTRNILADTVGRERSLRRKIAEARMALEIEQHYSKDQILEFYLNHIYFGQGSHLGAGCHGVQTAARIYFDKAVKDLSIEECAALAAIPKAPTTFNPFRAPERALRRRNMIIDRMERLGMIDKATAAREEASPLRMSRAGKPRVTSPYFVYNLERVLTENYDFDEDVLYRGGFQIYSTVDVQCQRILEEELTRGLPRVETLWEEAKPGRRGRELAALAKLGRSPDPAPRQNRLATIVEVRPDGLLVDIQGYRGFAPFYKEMTAKRNGEQPVWTGKYLNPYFDPDAVLVKGKLIDVHVEKVYPARRKIDVSLLDRTHVQGAALLLDAQTACILAVTGGADFYDQWNDGMYNRATLGGRQPGSAFKPLLYAVAVDHGRTAADVIMDSEVEYPGGYIPRNYENEFFGPTALIEALAHSRNAVTVKLFASLGMDTALQGYRSFDITKPTSIWRVRPELSLCLGTLDTSPLALAAAYVAFAHQGIVVEPTCLTRVTDLQGNVVREVQPRERRAISPQAAYITTCMLMETMRSGTGQTIGRNFDPVRTPQLAGKTGTTSYCVDAWFIGYTPELVLVVCVGFDKSRSLGPQMTGARVVGPIWTEMFRRILATRNDWKMKFDVPADIVLRDISVQTGLLAAADNPTGEKILYNVPFVKGTEPREVSEGYIGSTEIAQEPSGGDDETGAEESLDDSGAQPTDESATPALPDEDLPNVSDIAIPPGQPTAQPTTPPQTTPAAEGDLLAPPWR